MKFTAAILAAFASAAPASALGFKSSSSPADVRIMVHGLLHETSLEDQKIIQQNIVSAYNKAYSSMGSSLASFETMTYLPIPDGVQTMQDCSPCVVNEGDSQGEVILARVYQDCSPCGAFQDCSPCHESFEAAFCQGLRSSGSANLAGARDCSFSFLETPGVATNLPIKTSSTLGEATEAQVMMHGALSELSQSDLAIVDQSVMTVFNDAFATTGYTLSGFNAASSADVPIGNLQDCSPCGESAIVVFARAMQDCSPCRTNTMQDCSPCFDALEKALCNKLQKSGSVNLANVHSCSFRFVNNPVEVANIALQ